MRRPLLALVPLLLLAACKTELTCPVGQVSCGGTCASLQQSAEHCGACGNACAAGALCAAGSCACAPGLAPCGEACVDLASDPAHCGACGIRCVPPGPLCSTSGGSTACVGTCATGLSSCSGACVDLATDRLHCGTCGSPCAAGQACRSGSCRSDLLVGCPATSQVLPVTAALQPAGPARRVSGGLTALGLQGGVLYAAAGYPAAGVDLLPLDPRAMLAVPHVPLAGSDLEGVAFHDNLVFVSNASVGTLDVLAPDGQVLDEIPLSGLRPGPNPHGLAFVGSTGYLALTGFDDATGQAIATLDLSSLAACAAPDPGAPACGPGGGCPSGRHCVSGSCRVPCGAVTGGADLLALPAAHDPTGLPFPSQALAVGSTVYATLANLELADLGGGYLAYVKPAGHGRLAVVDGTGKAPPGAIDLGPSCGNPGGLALSGTTLWVSCGSFGYPASWPGRLVPVELGGTAPVVGAAVDVSAVVPNGIVFCGGKGYVPDQASGMVLPFDPATRTAGTAVEVCPLSAPPGPPDYGYAYVAGIACPP